MFTVWMGTLTDEAFPEAWHFDVPAVNGDGIAGIRSKVYLSPRFSQSKNVNPLWNEDLMFTVMEPFEDQLVLCMEEKIGNKKEELGTCVILLHGVEKRMDFKPPGSRCYNLEKHNVAENGERNGNRLNSRLHLRICFDGGYHVLDELTHCSSELSDMSWKKVKSSCEEVSTERDGRSILWPVKEREVSTVIGDVKAVARPRAANRAAGRDLWTTAAQMINLVLFKKKKKSNLLTVLMAR